MREKREERGGIGMGCLRLIDLNNRKIKEKNLSKFNIH
jgi:hypothetical protein